MDEFEKLLWERRVVGLASLLMLIATEARDRAREAGAALQVYRWRGVALYWTWRAAASRGDRTCLGREARHLDPAL